MGLKFLRFVVPGFIALSFVPFANAAPMLRLVKSSVGPVSIAVGSNGQTQVVEAYNAGDGTLSPTVTSSVPWISATVGAQAACTTTSVAAKCLPISVALNTASLQAGMQTGILTVNAAAGTLDAPQTITVTVYMGGSVPSSISVYVPPYGSVTNAAVTVATPTNSDLRYQATTKDGNSWLTMSISGNGSFNYLYPWAVQISPTAANVPGTYTGTMTLSNSSFALDNKAIAVTMIVTTQPIANGPSALNLTMAQGAPPYSSPYTAQSVTLTNSGNGTLTVSSVTPTVSSCGNTWLTVTKVSTGAILSVDPTGLSVGTCSASLSIASNAINSPTVVPVTLQVVAKGSPTVNYQGVLDNATFNPGDTVGQGDVVVVKGQQFTFAGSTTGGYTAGQAPPLSTDVGATQVLVNGTAAPIFYTLYNQIAFQMPVNTAIGTASVQVKRDDGGASNLVSVQVAARAPRLLLFSGTPYGAIVNATDNSYPVPTGYFAGLTCHPANPGDTLVLYGIGLGPTNPSVATGQPAPSTNPLASVSDAITVNFSSGLLFFRPATAVPIFAGLTPTYAGLYQLNVTIPADTPTGTVYVQLSYPDGSFSNKVEIAIQGASQ